MQDDMQYVTIIIIIIHDIVYIMNKMHGLYYAHIYIYIYIYIIYYKGAI